MIAARVATLQRQHGVDLRCQVTVTSLEGDAQGRLRRAHLSDGSTLDTEVAVVALGAIRNIEWLRDCGLAAGAFGVACDAGCLMQMSGGLTRRKSAVRAVHLAELIEDAR